MDGRQETGLNDIRTYWWLPCHSPQTIVLQVFAVHYAVLVDDDPLIVPVEISGLLLLILIVVLVVIRKGQRPAMGIIFNHLHPAVQPLLQLIIGTTWWDFGGIWCEKTEGGLMLLIGHTTINLG